MTNTVTSDSRPQSKRQAARSASNAGEPVAVETIMDQDWKTHDFGIDGDALDYLNQDWLLTNGTGAFSMGSVPGVNTRRYHGLLVAATQPPVGRVVALNQMLEQLQLHRGDDIQSLAFNSCMFPTESGDVFAPHGHIDLKRFEKGLSVCWTYQWGEITFIRELFLHWQQQAATLRYVVRGLKDAADAVTLKLSPMLTLRDFHSLLHKDQAGKVKVEIHTEGITVSRGDVAATFSCPKATRFARGRDWWHNIVYRTETERGQDDIEDYFVPGAFEVELDPSQSEHELTFSVALGHQPADPADAFSDARQDHLAPILSHIEGAGEGSDARDAQSLEKKPSYFEGVDVAGIKRMLAVAADDFVVSRTIKGESLSTILAGYPWFADWGRDTFIALPGLLIETGRFEEARKTLAAFAAAIRNGLVPNRFDDYDDNAAHYNTVDASLWFVNAALRYKQATADQTSWDEWLCDAVLSVMDAYIKGTDYDIRVTGDGLVTAGSPNTQLTWMDAACGDTVFTPRHGKAVEINALWYSALVGVSDALGDEHRAEATHFKKLSARIKRSFPKVFWNEEADCLIDHVWTDDEGNEHPDYSIRPNQSFVASLPHSPLPMTKCRVILKAVAEKLLTPFGLRTLPEDDPSYHARYTGNQFIRDGAYHQGTVWAWLIGPYAEGVLRCGKFSDAARREAAEIIRPLLDNLADVELGQLHEIYEAEEPHRPVGCIAQAWSISEVLRVVRMIERGS